MNTISNIPNMTKRIDKELKKSARPAPNKELLKSLEEIKDYKNGKIKLDSYDDVKSLRKALTDD